MAIDCKHVGRLAQVGAYEQPGCRGGLLGNAEQARIDIGGAGRYHSQRGLGPGEDVAGMMHHAIASHRGNDIEPVGNGLGGEGPGVFGRLRPHGLDLESALKDSDHRTMPATR